MYLFLDDERELTDKYRNYLEKHPRGLGHRYYNRSWIIIKNIDEFKAYILKHGIPAVMSLDHDLGEGEGRDGIDCIKWLKEYCLDNKKRFVSLVGYHSANPIGIDNMKSILDGLTIATRNYE